MKDNLTDWLKSNDKKRKKNNKKNGKKGKKPESTSSTKSLMTEKGRLGNTKKPRKKSWDKSSKTSSKLKEEWENTNLSNKLAGKGNMNGQSTNRPNYFNKSRRSKKSAEWFCCNSKKNNSKWTMPGKNTARK